MSATDELRRLLDERGVEWEDMSARFPTGMLWCTSWTSKDGELCTALEGADDIPDGKLSVQALLTPAQAIAATLGSGTCHNEGDSSDFCCSECGVRMYMETDDTYTMITSDEHIIKRPNYCPNCGRRVQ